MGPGLQLDYNLKYHFSFNAVKEDWYFRYIDIYRPGQRVFSVKGYLINRVIPFGSHFATLNRVYERATVKKPKFSHPVLLIGSNYVNIRHK